jgi:integrase/recombinase XerD
MEYLNKFLDMIKAERGLAKNTLISYKNDLEYFIKNTKNPIKITALDIKNHLRQLYSDGISENSLSRKISSIKQFFNFLQLEEIIKENPALLIEHPKHSKKIPKYLTEKEVDTLLKNAKRNKTPSGIRFYCMLELLYATGLRVSELVSIPISAIQKKYKKDGFFNIDNFLIIKGKGNKERLVVINKTAKNILKDYLDLRTSLLGEKHSKWLFTIMVKFPTKKNYPDKLKYKKDNHISRQVFALILKELALKSNIDEEKVSPHIIRHSFATHLLNNGADLRVLQELLGHSDISTTQIYTHILDSKLKNIVNTLHPLAKKSGE